MDSNHQLKVIDRRTAKLLADFATGVYVNYKSSSPGDLSLDIRRKFVLETLSKATVDQVKAMSNSDANGFVIWETFNARAWNRDGYFGFVAVKPSEFDKQLFQLMSGSSLAIEAMEGFFQLTATKTLPELLAMARGGRTNQTALKNLETLDKKREIVVAFRGTDKKNSSDLLQDLSILRNTFVDNHPIFASALFPGAVSVHGGFLETYLSCSSVVEKTVRSLLPKDASLQKNTILYITGHSLGGALATLCGVHLVLLKDGSGRLLEIPTPLVYTFASPHVGNSNFVKLFNGLIADKNHPIIKTRCSWRFVRSKDPIPRLLNPHPGYQHVDSLHELDAGSSHAMTGYRDLVNQQFVGAFAVAKSAEFPHSSAEFNYALSEQPILLNGMKVIFDQPVGVYPVTLESKEEARRNG